jgi:hypothetical protein
MPRWYFITLATLFWLYALYQVRMYFIYTGRIHSQVIGNIDGGPTLRAVAIRSAVAFVVYGFLLLVMLWPRVLTYVSVVRLCMEIIDATLGWFGRGVHGITIAVSTEKGRRYQFFLQSVGVLIRAALVLVCAHFFGF